MGYKGKVRNQKSKTVHVRIYKDTRDELMMKFPKTAMCDLVDIAYNSSALKLESFLRKKNVKEKDIIK